MEICKVAGVDSLPTESETTSCTTYRPLMSAMKDGVAMLGLLRLAFDPGGSCTKLHTKKGQVHGLTCSKECGF